MERNQFLPALRGQANMLVRRNGILSVFALLCITAMLGAQSAPSAPHTFFRIKAGDTVKEPVSGRLLIFLKQGSGDKDVQANEFRPSDTYVAAQEIHDVEPGKTVEVDADQIAFPQPFTELAAGQYEAQAVLDVNHSYNYGGRTAEDWVSPAVTLAGWRAGGGTEPELVLDHHPATDPRETAFEKMKAAVKPDEARLEEFESPALSAFWGHSTQI